MTCGVCDKDVAECICPDRAERLTAILNSKYIYIGAEYAERIRKNIESANGEKTINE